MPPSTDTRALIEGYFAAFARRDGAAMAACYHADATFRDPVFELRGAEVGAMWRMLCSRAADLRVEASGIVADGAEGRGDWQAWYTFSTTGRRVHNIVHSRFRCADGLIIEQVDDFAFWRWSRQALGPIGHLLGWTPLLRAKVRGNACTALERFIAAERLATPDRP